jgi:hydroxymethylpyrimidine pyrophosphatase-like HAD family hydrolase
MVIDTAQRVTLHRMLMEPALAAALCAEFEAAGHAALALQDTAAAGLDYLVSASIPLNESTAMWMEVTAAGLKAVSDLASASRHEHTVRVSIVATPEEITQVTRVLDAKFAGRIYHGSVRVPSQGVDVLEVFDPSVNKWEGIQHVAARHGIRPEQIVAIGDDVNDLHMIQNAGLGVAMGNAKPEVQAIAKRVIGTNLNEGLAEFLEELVATHAVEPLDEEDNTTEAA